MYGQPLTSPIVKTAARQLPAIPTRGNPRITKQVHFENFAGGRIVGISTATHPHDESCGSHNHRGVDEIFIVVSGRGIIEVGSALHYVSPGDSVTVPAGIMHNVTTARLSDGPFVVHCITVVAVGHEDDPQPWLPTSP